MMASAVAKSDLRQELHAAFLHFGSTVFVGVKHRQNHIVNCGSARQKIESLKNKTNFFIPYSGKFTVRQICDILTVKKIFAGSRPVQKTNDVHQSRFAGTGCSH